MKSRNIGSAPLEPTSFVVESDGGRLAWTGAVRRALERIGTGSLAKVVLAMAHGEIPPSLHFRAANPHLALARDHLSVVTVARDWPRYSGSAVAGVSATQYGAAALIVIASGLTLLAPEVRRMRAGPAAEVQAPEAVAETQAA